MTKKSQEHLCVVGDAGRIEIQLNLGWAWFPFEEDAFEASFPSENF